jgi:SOS-response transcriptional repressor LexA
VKKPITDANREDAARLRSIFTERQIEAVRAGRPKVTQEKIALACGWSGQSAVGQYFRALTPLNISALLKLAKALNFEPSEVSPQLAATLPNASPMANNAEEPVYLVSNGLSTSKETLSNVRKLTGVDKLARKYPVISWDAAGNIQDAHDAFGNAYTWLESPVSAGKHGYWLEVGGPSMLPKFDHGTLILVQPDDFELVSGKLYIARLLATGEKTFKRFLRDGGSSYLQSLNPIFPIIPIDETVEIIGRVVAAQYKAEDF